VASSFDRRSTTTPEQGPRPSSSGATPGRRTLTEGLVPAAAAEAGVSGEGQPLPHLDTIQASFGRGHDLSAVRAHVGGGAAEASESLGAHGYAFGQHVAFRDQPDLRLAAHEAAHVVQQREGLHLSDGMSHPGDAAELHAEAVADRVVAGASAADLLPGGTAPSFGRAVQRQVAPSLWGRKVVQRYAPGGGGDSPASPAGEGAPGDPACNEAEMKKVEAFKKAGPYRIKDHVPSTGAGAFDVAYHPMSDHVFYTVRISVSFVDYHGEKWGDDAEKNAWWDDYRRTVYARWDAKFNFHVKKPCWDALRARPLTIITKDDADPHFKLEVKKMKADDWFIGSVNYPDKLQAPGKYGKFPGPQHAEIGSSDLTPQPDWQTAEVAGTEPARMEKANPKTIKFAFNSDALPADAPAKLAEFGHILSMTHHPVLNIDLTGHASSEGDDAYNLDLSRRRAESVKKAIKADLKIVHNLNVVPKGEQGAKATADWRRVDITVPPIDAAWKNDYDRAGHEFGHMIGLDDEYPGANTPRHYQLVEEAFGKKVAETYLKRESRSASLMSSGLDVRPYHYVTFWEALGRASEPTLTRTDWAIED
jgi:outer membrane protein OmpA-like peptidoglycan-associated protein